MSKISIVFGAVFFPEKETYLKQRISLLHAAGSSNNNSFYASIDLPANYVSDILQAANNEIHIPLGEPIDVSAIQGENGEELRKRKVCMLAEVSRFFPLIDGEYVETNEVSYLTEDWEDFPAYSITLKQTTNFSISFYIYPTIQADTANQQLIESSSEISEDAMLFTAANIDLNFGDVARQLSGGLAGLLPKPMNTIATQLITLLWPAPDKAAEQWRQMYDTLQIIVRNGLAENNVTQARQKLYGFILFLNNSYIPLRDDPRVTKKERFDALNPYDKVFFLEIVNVFMFTEAAELGLAMAALANFMTGACLHLGLNQERALQDTNNSDPSRSPYAISVSNLAKTYADFALKTAPAIKNRRMEQIDTAVRENSNTSCRGGAAGRCSTSHSFWFQDSNNNFRSATYSHNGGQKRTPDSRGDANRALQEYRNKISAEMDALLKEQVYDVIENWQKLFTNPIPIK
ncbi:MAG: hypothetical protein J0I41_10995 [Filimonas sp.]|nr:hypothetical protein [Filimonas sp.]